MFLKAGALSLALLMASRLLGLARESAQAAAFGASGVGDVAVLMFALPDWVAGVLASGALAYVLVPAWARQTPEQVRAGQRRVAIALLAGGALLAAAMAMASRPLQQWLAGGLPAALQPLGAQALAVSAVAVPLALLASLWTTRLQHERDFVGMYAANLVVNATLIAALLLAGMAWASGAAPLPWLAGGLLAAMALRLAWLHWRQRHHAAPEAVAAQEAAAAGAAAWLWAVLAAGLPLALPFAARSIASQSGEGALATFNYAWKLVELPLLLAIQLVATLAFPAIARAAAQSPGAAAQATRAALALAWSLAAASVVGLLLGAPALARLLFGWGRMQPQALAELAQWGRIGAWGLLPQALAAVALTVLATRQRLQPVVWAYAAALVALLWLGAQGWTAGGVLMFALDLAFAGVAIVALVAMGQGTAAMLPWRALASGAACVVAAVALQATGVVDAMPLLPQLALAMAAGLATLAAGWWSSADVRQALRR